MTARCLRFQALLQREGWLAPAYVSLDSAGCILRVAASPDPKAASAPVEDVPGYALPGMPNAHSHAFQYAMAGLAEHAPQAAALGDFWQWREALYRLAAQIQPEQLRAVAAMLYAEMLRHGITGVAEFHYLHNDSNGAPYQDSALMSRSLFAAAEDAGIQLTLLPVRYALSNFATPATPQQRRFLSPTPDSYLRLLEAVRDAAQSSSYPDLSVGLGVHSLRAVASDEVITLLTAPFSGPAHLHVAEQEREVSDCLASLKRRPVAWLLENLPLDERFNLVHATHMEPAEVQALARSGATVVLCPSTEGNLGDGFFPLTSYLTHGGRFAIGSDSQVSLNPWEELRWLDYGERLKQRKRNVLHQQPGDDSASLLFDSAWTRGRLALGQSAAAYFASGAPFDSAVLDPEHPVLMGRSPERCLASMLYAGDPSCLLGTMRRGTWLVKGQQHLRGAGMKPSFRRAMLALLPPSASP